MNNTARTLSRTSTTLPEVFRWHTSNLQLFAFPHFPSPQWFLPVCGSLREVGEVGRFAFGCGIVCFVGRAGWWWILNGSSAGYSNGDGVGKDMAGNQQKWVSVLQFGKPLQEFIAVLSFLFSVLWAKTALSERYASLQFLWMYLTEKESLVLLNAEAVSEMQYRTSPRFPAILSSFILFLSTDVNRIIYVVPEFFLQFLYSICFSADFPRIIYTNINTCFTSGASACLRKHFSILNRNRILWAFFHTCSTSCTSFRIKQ